MSKKSDLDKLISGLCELSPRKMDLMRRRNTNKWLISMIKISGSALSVSQIADVLNGKSVPEAMISEYQLAEACRKLRTEFSYMIDLNTKLDEKNISLINKILNFSNSTKYRKNNIFIDAMEYMPPKPENIPKFMRACSLEIRSDEHHIDALSGALRTHNMIISIWPFEEMSDLTAYAAMSYELLNAGYPLPTLYMYKDEHLSLSSEFIKTGPTKALKKLLIESLISECSDIKL